MKKFLNGVHIVNILAIAAQVAGSLGAIPAFAANPYLLAAQAVLAALLPSLGGVGHVVAFGENQDPAKR